MIFDRGWPLSVAFISLDSHVVEFRNTVEVAWVAVRTRGPGPDSSWLGIRWAAIVRLTISNPFDWS